MKETDSEEIDFEKIDMRAFESFISSSDSDSEPANEQTPLRISNRVSRAQQFSTASTSSAVPTNPTVEVLKALLEAAKVIIYPEWRAIQLVGALYSMINTFSVGFDMITAMRIRNNAAIYLTPCVGIPALLITAFRAAKISPDLIEHCERVLRDRANNPRNQSFLTQLSTTGLRAGRSVLTTVDACDRVVTASTDGISNVPFLNQLVATLIVLGVILDKDEPIGTEVDTSFFVGYLTFAICSVIGVLIAIQGYYQLLNAKYPAAERSTANHRFTHEVTRFVLGAVGGAATWHAIIFWLMLFSGPGVVEEKVPYFTRLALTLVSFFVSGYLLSRPEAGAASDATLTSNALLTSEEDSTSDVDTLLDIASLPHAVLLSDSGTGPHETLTPISTHSTKDKLIELWNDCVSLCTLNNLVDSFRSLLDLLNGLMLNIGFLLLIYAASSETRLTEDAISDQTWSWLVVAPLLTTMIVAVKQLLYFFPNEREPEFLLVNDLGQSSYQSFPRFVSANSMQTHLGSYFPSGESSGDESDHEDLSPRGIPSAYRSEPFTLEAIETSATDGSGKEFDSGSEEDLGSENRTRYTR